MTHPNTLVVYFSRTGTTRRAAEAIAAELDADIEPLLERTSRRGVLGYLRSGYEALMHKRAEVLPLEHAPADYALVIVGSPVWNGSLSSPVRAFLEEHRDQLSRVAFFVTEGGRGSERTFAQMEAAAGRKAEAELVLRAGEVERGAHLSRVQRFVQLLPSFALPRYAGEPYQPHV